MSNKELFDKLDQDIRELLELVHQIKLSYITGSPDKKKIDKALFLSQKIQAGIYEIVFIEKGVKGAENFVVHGEDG